MTSMCRKMLKYLRNGFTMLEITYEFAKILGKWLRCMVHGLSI